MTRIKVGQDIDTLIQSAHDYTSDAIITLDSARDKMAFLDLDHTNEDVQNLFIATKNQLKVLQAVKRRLRCIMLDVQP